MTNDNAKISWEAHDDLEDGFQSVCGRFEAHIDPVYGYFTLHLSEDTCISHCESMNMADLTRTAEAMIESGQAPAEPVF